MTVWNEVEDALEKIIDDYEKVNHVISLYQDDRSRMEVELNFIIGTPR